MYQRVCLNRCQKTLQSLVYILGEMMASVIPSEIQSHWKEDGFWELENRYKFT